MKTLIYSTKKTNIREQLVRKIYAAFNSECGASVQSPSYLRRAIPTKLTNSSTCLANSNSNEAPCNTDSSNNNIQHLTNQWGVPSSPQINRNSSPTNPTSLSQLGQPLGVHSQGLTTFGQNGLHNSTLHGYTTAHNASKGFSHQPFYSWY